ncbi:MAG TPA: GspE/PulE family protein [Candidatus Hydrogenedentes bacterium]|nr:GspE/PulE family protein [Candidatus Hydrogenedentota bacterium]
MKQEDVQVAGKVGDGAPPLEQGMIAALASGDTGVSEAIDLLLREAASQGASDVHLEPWEDRLAIRFRLDGLLHNVAALPKEHLPRLVARVKVLARIPVYQRDMPRDGRIDPRGDTGRGAMRVSTFPTVYGEKIVIRLLETHAALLDLPSLGFAPDVLDLLERIVERPQGLLLLTGPSSSGKTTTIYAVLRALADSRTPPPHMATIEDPVEYRLGNISQTEVNARAGLTYGTALRAVLRQDPEIIMIGEIRDPETAQTAVQAGLTGHLVISTIHSGTAAGVFTRLLDMGVEPYLLASSVTGVLAQRLVRVICAECKTPQTPSPEDLLRFGLSRGAQLHMGTGCAACRNTGYAGRTAIGEALSMNEDLAEALLRHPRTRALHEIALRMGMKPLLSQGVAKARAGVTTLNELRRVLPVEFSSNVTRQSGADEESVEP